MKNRNNPIVNWAPRILSLLFICFLMLFSLDVFESGRSISEMIMGFFMHNIPVLILSIVVGVAWHKPWVGTVAFTLAGLLYGGLMIQSSIRYGIVEHRLTAIAFISGPAFLIAYLYYRSR